MMTGTHMAKTAEDVKKQVHEVIDRLPDDVSWDDVLYHLEVVRDIEAGRADIKAGRVHTTEEVRRHFGLTE